MLQHQPLSISEIPNSASSHQLANSLIDAYFSNYHITYPFVHEATFRAKVTVRNDSKIVQVMVSKDVDGVTIYKFSEHVNSIGAVYMDYLGRSCKIEVIPDGKDQ